MPQHETMPDTLGKSIQIARSLSQQETEAGISTSTPDASRFPCHNLRRIPKCLWQRESRPDIPEKTSEVHCCPRSYSSGTTSFLPQLEETHKIPPSRQDDGPPLHCLQRNSMFLIKHERRLDFLYGTPESPQEHRHKSRETLKSLPQIKIALCTPNHLEMRADSLASPREGCQLSTHTSRGGFSQL